MNITDRFERNEIKFLITESQYLELLSSLKEMIKPDVFPEGTVRSLYYDTPDRRLITRSLEGPAYKEKLRVRAYKTVDDNSTVFVELKKKYNSVVYKRRVTATEKQAERWLDGTCPRKDTQIEKEIDSFLTHYGTLIPTAYISCDRRSYVTLDNLVRITFDMNVRGRNYDLSLESPPYGIELCPGKVILEIKTPTVIPLEIAKKLSDLKIYKSSFSKYGALYIKTGGNTEGDFDNVINF